MRLLIQALALASLSLLPACASTTTLTASYQAVEIPSEPKELERVKDATKAEPEQPEVPPAGAYGASDIRAKAFGLYAVELRRWGRGLVEAIEKREKAAATLAAKQREDREKALARLAALRASEPQTD